MEQYGVSASWTENTIKVLPQAYKPIRFTVESDWSAASYWYEIMALSKNAEIELLGLFKNSLQGDAAGAKLFAQLGVGTTYTKRGVVLKHTGNICERLVYNFVNEPDLAQTFVVTCVLLNIPFRFTGLQSLKIKETDRIEALKTELRKLGYVLTDHNDSILEWNGERRETGVASGNRHLRGSSDGFVIRSRRFGTSRGDRDRPPASGQQELSPLLGRS